MAADRKGFALVFALWVLVGGAALALGTAALSRDALGAAHNRESLEQATWLARGCLELAHDAIQDLAWAEGTSADERADNWRGLDDRLGAEPAWGRGCVMEVVPGGLALDVNALDAAALTAVLQRAGEDGAHADSLTDAIIDWRDADDVRRPLGAERSDYISALRVPPRNNDLRSEEELTSIRGFSERLSVLHLFGVRGDRIYWKRAPLAVLAGLPGITDEALAVLESRGREDVMELPAIASFPELSAEARRLLSVHSEELLAGTTSLPEFWLIRARASVGSPAISVEIEARAYLVDGQIDFRDRLIKP